GLNPIPLQVEGATLSNKLQTLQADLTSLQGSLVVAQSKSPALIPGIQARIQSDQAQIALTQQLLDISQGHSTTVVAPLDGEVAAVNITPGLRVTPGAALVQIVYLSQIEVTANLPISEEPNIVPGASAHLTFPTLPDLTLKAVVRSIAPAASANGLTFQV